MLFRSDHLGLLVDRMRHGFGRSDANQWAPAIYEGTRAVEPPHGDPNYHFDRDLADHAIDWIRTQHAMAPNKPFFCYYTPGTAHAPHHAPKDWIAKYKGQFDQGWDHVREETLARQKKLGVVPDARMTGLYPLLVLESAERAAKLGYRCAEVGWTLEDNQLINSGIEAAGGQIGRAHV